jgi:hypothetical protein
MAYEVYTRSRVRVEAPSVSIRPDGRVAINAAATRILEAAGIKSVLLLWDKASYRMAIKSTSKGDKNAYVVSFAPEGHSSTIRAKSFFSYVGWGAPRREMLPASWNASDKMFEIMLPPAFLKPAGTLEKPRKHRVI